jgi:ABC-2 type transport system permease protein
MKAFIALVQKDLRLYFSDRRAVMLTLAVPIAIASFFGSLFGGRSGKSEPHRVALQVVDLDQSRLSREIVANLAGDENLSVTTNTEASARDLVRLGKAPLAVVFPKDFGEQSGGALFGPGRKPELVIIRDPSRAAEAGMIKGILTQHIMRTVSRAVFSGTAGGSSLHNSLVLLKNAPGEASADRRALEDMLSSMENYMNRRSTNPSAFDPSAGGGMSMPFSSQEEVAVPEQKGKYNGYAHSFAGMGVQFILMAAIELGVGILLERQRGLWKRLRSAPLSRTLLLSSKATSSAIISTITLSCCFLFARLVFGVKVEGSLAGFVLCIMSFSLFAASVGLLIASFGKTPAASRGLAIPIILIMVMLGGAWIPAFIFPEWLQKVTLGIPTRWAVDALDAMTWRGLGFNSAIVPVLVLLGFAVACGGLALIRFRWEAEGS